MRNLIVFYLLFALAGSSCSLFKKSSNQDQSFGQISPVHSSSNSLDWNGTYRGFIPCADCPGIKIEITLKNDLTYILSKQYMGKSDSVYRKEGTFSWNDAGSHITLNTPGGETNVKHLFVGESMLWMLDVFGNKIEGELSENYKLFKPGANSMITNKYWKLIELYGEEIIPSDERERQPHFILLADENRATGHTGCNVFNGSYELTDHKKISFSPLASTRMFCRDIEYEDDFLIMFERARSFKRIDDSLHLLDPEENLLGVFVWEFFNSTSDAF